MCKTRQWGSDCRRFSSKTKNEKEKKTSMAPQPTSPPSSRQMPIKVSILFFEPVSYPWCYHLGIIFSSAHNFCFWRQIYSKMDKRKCNQVKMTRADILEDTNFAPVVFSVVRADDDEVVTRVKGYIGKLFVFFQLLFHSFNLCKPQIQKRCPCL